MFRGKNDREDHASFHDDRDLAAFLDALPGDRAANDAGNRRQGRGHTVLWAIRGVAILCVLFSVLFGVLFIYRSSTASLVGSSFASPFR